MLAHGRTKAIAVEYETDEEPPHYSSWRIHEWEKLSVDKVENYAKCVRKAIEMINRARTSPDDDLWNQGMRGRKVELTDKTQGRVCCEHGNELAAIYPEC